MIKLSPILSRTFLLFSLCLLIALAFAGRTHLFAQETPAARQMAAVEADRRPVPNLKPLGATPCIAGMAGSYPCDNIDLLAFIPIANIGGGGNTNDIWGWTDPLDGTEYAIVGRDTGTSFLDITDPSNPLYLGNLPAHNNNASLWRGLKVYQNHVFIGSEAGGHGMQVFDLTELRDVVAPPVTFSETDHFNGFGSSHTIAINEDTGFAYAAGSNTCNGGLHMVNIQTPTNPTNAGCFSTDGYSHETQCVTYNGPDAAHVGKEICFNSNEDTLTIVDVTVKAAPVQLSRTGYAGSGYTHQGWLTEDHTYFFLDDEFDENNNGHNTRTYIWDVSDLDDPSVIDHHDGPTPAIDHNQYVHGRYLYQSNYTAGVYILDTADAANGNLTQVAYFDLYPANNNPSYDGTWTNYPYFESGVVIATSIEEGFFLLRPNLYAANLTPTSHEAALPGETAVHHFTLTNIGRDDAYTLTLQAGDWPATLLNTSPISLTAGATATLTVEVDVPLSEIIFASDTFTLTAASAGDPNLVLTAIGQTDTLAPGVTTSGSTSDAGEMGDVITYSLTITNSGNYTDTFAVTVTGNNWSTLPAATTVGPLAAGASTTLAVAVTIGSGHSDHAHLTFTSTLNPAVSTQLTLTTLSTSDHTLYLPIARSDNE